MNAKQIVVTTRAETLRGLRRALGLTLTQVALHTRGLGAPQLSTFERGIYPCSREIVERVVEDLAAIYGQSPDSIRLLLPRIYRDLLGEAA